MSPVYVFAILAFLFVIYTENQKMTQQNQQQLALAQLNLSQQQLAIQSANSPAGLINSVVGGLGNIANLAGFGLD
jgi:hypothetical protein